MGTTTEEHLTGAQETLGSICRTARDGEGRRQDERQEEGGMRQKEQRLGHRDVTLLPACVCVL